MDILKIKRAERSHLTWVNGDLYDISGRIKDIEQGLFVMRNHRKKKFEVHSTDNTGDDTYCFTVPCAELDARTLFLCRELIRHTRNDKMLSDLDRHNRMIGEKRERHFEQNMESASREISTEVSLAVEKDETHSGYMRSHYMGGKRQSDGQRSAG
jgi:hypothetical protein